MASDWNILMGSSGAALSNYGAPADLNFADPLYDFGIARILLVGLDGHSTPAEGWIIKIIWDQGLATEQVHWQGIIDSIQKKEEGDIYSIRAYTIDGATLHTNQTGGIRNYLAKTPHTIIQAAGTPNPILTNNQGNTAITYGTAAGVANKVNGTNPGISLTQFVADSTSLFNNMRRLCLQSQYNAFTGLTADAGSTASTLKDAALTQADGYWTDAIVTMTSGPNTGLSRKVTAFDATTDTLTFLTAFPNAIAAGNTYNITIYGLEWNTTLEGANNSTPTFYLVKRRERAATYTPETFNIFNDFHQAKRGYPVFPGIDSVRVIGGGDGNSRIDSGTIGTGLREAPLKDKAIFNQTNAINMANRVQQVYDKTIEMISAETFLHNSATRAGDFIKITQTGVADTTLRVIMRLYDMSRRMFIFLIGRPAPMGPDLLRSLIGTNDTDQTSPQFTDLNPAPTGVLLNNGTGSAVKNILAGAFADWTFTLSPTYDPSVYERLIILLSHLADAAPVPYWLQIGVGNPGVAPGSIIYSSSFNQAVANSAQFIPLNLHKTLLDIIGGGVLSTIYVRITNADVAAHNFNVTVSSIDGSPYHQHNTL